MKFQKHSDLLGRSVVNETGMILGEVSDLIVNTETWMMTDLQVKVDKASAKEAGLRTPLFGNLLVLIEVALVRSVSDQIVIAMAQEGLKDYVEQRQDEEKEAKKAAKAAAKEARRASRDDDDEDAGDEEVADEVEADDAP